MPPATKSTTSKSGSKDVGGKSSQTSSSSKSKSSGGSRPTGSGSIGSKGGGASTQKAGAGGNAGRVTQSSLGQAKATQSKSRSTALGKVSQAAQANVSRGTGSGVIGSKGGGASMQRPGMGTQTAPNGSYYGPKGGNALNNAARMAAARSVGFSQPALNRTPGDAQMLGRMMMAESGTIKNAFGGLNTQGLQGVADVVRNRMLSDRFTPDTVPGILTQRKQFSPIADGSFARTPANVMATRIAESVLSGESPPVVGNALNYGNLDTINNLRGYSSEATKRAFNAMQPTAVISDARNPVSRSHTFGTIGRPSDVSFNGLAQPARANVAAASPAAAAEAARIARRDAALQTLAGPLRQQPPMPTARPPGLGMVPRPTPRPPGLGAVAPVPNARPLQSFVTQDPRLNMPTGAFPAAKVPTPNMRPLQSFVAQDPRLGVPGGAFPAKPPSAFAADPRVSIPATGYPAEPRHAAGTYTASYQPRTTVASDPRVGLSPGGFPTKPASMFADPRVGLPTGAFPQAKPVSIVAGDPRAAMRPGSYPAAPMAPVGWSGVPPMGGALPADIGTALGVWSTTRVPPAAPHLGTPASQTAQAVPDAGGSWGDWLQQKTGVDVQKVATTVQEKQQELKDNVEKYGQNAVLTRLQQMAGQTPRALTDPGSGRGLPSGLGAPSGYVPQPPPQQQTVQLTLPELLAIQQQMIAQGATPEELAVVQTLIDQASTA